MKTGYRGYIIDVTANQKDDFWTAQVLIGPVAETPKALRHMGELDGDTSQREAENVGLQWGRKRLNLYAHNKLALRYVHTPRPQ